MLTVPLQTIYYVFLYSYPHVFNKWYPCVNLVSLFFSLFLVFFMFSVISVQKYCICKQNINFKLFIPNLFRWRWYSLNTLFFSLTSSYMRVFIILLPNTNVYLLFYFWLLQGLFESNVISTLSANMSSDFTNVAKSLDVSDDEIEPIKQNNSEDNGLYRKAVIQKWLERNKLDKPESVRYISIKMKHTSQC